MNKTTETVISILLALLLLASLPISAMAEGEPHVKEDTENNNISNAIIDTGVNVTTNSAPVWENNGSIGTNNAPINTNNGTVGTNNSVNIQTNNGTVTTANGGYINTNNGTITTANGTNITTNTGDIGTSSGPIGTNTSTGVVGTANGPVYTNDGKVGESNSYIGINTGTVTDNNYRIDNSSGTVVNNNSTDGIGTNTGTVTNSAGFIYENNGQVGTVGTKGQAVDPNGQSNLVNNKAVKNEDGTYQEGTGVVDENYGSLINNGDSSTKDKDSGTLNTNEGYVYYNSGTLTTNNGDVRENNGSIGENQGEIWLNGYGASLGTNGKDGNINVNVGTIDTNDGKIDVNSGGTIGTNNGTVGVFGFGTIETNNGTITESHGNVVTNGITGVVNDKGGSKVENNFGTLNANDGKTYLGLSWGSDTKSLTLIDGAVVKGTQKNLDEAAAEVTAAGPTRSGYKLTGYTWLTSDGTKVTDTANYTMNAPTWLKLLWEKITGKPAASSNDEPEVKPVKAAVPSTVKAEDVKVGTVVRAKGQLFKVIEMDDGSITVVTMGTLSKKDMEDLMAFLALYLTPEQIELLLGSPELISQELADTLFGGNTNHLVFKAAKNLFAM